MGPKTRKFVSYCRVSTAKQQRSGLGLEAQRAAIREFLAGRQWKGVAEYVEVETGKNDTRPELRKALHRAKVTGATLVIAKLDCLSRNLRFIAELQESKVKFVCADMADATELTIHIFASLAQHERKVISERTKRALQAVKEIEADPIRAKERRKLGKKPLGNPNGARALLGAGKGNAAAVAEVIAKADRHAQDVLPVIDDIRSTGITGLRGIATELNARGILTARSGRWYAMTVRNLLARSGRLL
jgi:DNA invertase Pin-like site-specific DNA recombinase